MDRAGSATFLIALAVVVATPLPGGAQSPQPSPYRPGLGDLMTMTVQPRHIKLALAGQAANWPLAKYQLHELEEAFERVERTWPKYRGLPVGGMIDSIVKGPMAEVERAIEAKDQAKFAASIERLSEGCNACHQAANVGFVAIKPPVASSFPDQDFAPRKP